MDSAENEQNLNIAEVGQSRELAKIPNAEKNRELQQLLKNHKSGRVRAVSLETQTALQNSEKRLKAAGSIGYTSEKLAQLRREQGIDVLLGQNQRKIETLGLDAQARIGAVKTSDTGGEISAAQSVEHRENNIERERVIELAQEKRGYVLIDILTSEIVSNGFNLVPFAGSGKMLVESIAGKTLSGEKLTGKERIIHAAMGAGSLALDFTGISEAKDIVTIAGKSVGLVEKVGARLAERGANKGARIFLTTSKFMAQHPQLTARAEQFAEMKIKEQIQNIKDYRKQAA